MTKKQTIKDIMNEKFNKDDIHKELLIKFEEKRKMKINSLMRFALPVCVMVIMCGVVVLNNNSKVLKPDTKVEQQNKNNIVVNDINDLGAFRLDAKAIDAKVENFIANFEFLKNIEIPRDLTEKNAIKLFVRGEDSENYDKLRHYEISYFNDNDRSISVSFSDTEKPLRDYRFPDEGSKLSIINNINLKIYKYEDLYMTEFEYKGYNFDIETVGISESELVELLKSIIK